jgi:D-alanine-D-alanine ligase
MELRDPELTRVSVLMGGWSAEREVSLSSGRACAKALDEAGFQVTMIDVQRNVIEQLAEARPDVAFNALHGTWGEDGTVQALLETLQIPYTHSGVLASALAMDKRLCKAALSGVKMPVAEDKVVSVEQLLTEEVMPLPYVVKPVADGSSVGVHIIDRGSNNLEEIVQQSGWAMEERVMVERFVPGRELTCAVMGNVALGVIDIVPKIGFYDYKAKYETGGSEHILPADIPQHLYRRVQRLALAAHMEIGCMGVSRSDFRYNDTEGRDGELVFLEINTQPGMTATSLVPEMAAHAGHSFPELVTWMVNDAGLNR